MAWSDFCRALRLAQSGYCLASQEVVALTVGLHPRRWSRLEAGSTPTVDEALLICSAAGCTVEEAAHLAAVPSAVEIAVTKGWTRASWWSVPYDWRPPGMTAWPRGPSVVSQPGRSDG